MSSGEVAEVLADDDIIELSSDNNDKLKEILLHIDNIRSINEKNGSIVIHLERGKGDTAFLNHYCYTNGVILSHLASKKQRLEDKFFELTGS
jgi:ABC-2 type transport system ATP-binding protein